MICYNTDNKPSVQGVYTCRVKENRIYQDRFLYWNGKDWEDVKENSRYRAGTVDGWIGPLQRSLR